MLRSRLSPGVGQVLHRKCLSTWESGYPRRGFGSSALADVSAEYRLDVDDRRFVQPSIAVISTRCRPMGFGRSGERVLKTPSCALEETLKHLRLED
jgi:hypothetical protein